MKRRATSLMFFVLLSMSMLIAFSVGTQLHAEETENTTRTSDQLRTNQEMRQELRQERKSKLTEQVQNRIINLAANTYTRLSSVTERMRNISTRLETRIQKMKAEGIDTAKAEARLSEAVYMLVAAEEALTTFANAESAVRGDTPKHGVEILRVQYKSTGELIKNIRFALKETVTLLKEAVKAQNARTGVSDAVQNETSLLPQAQ